MSLSHVLRKNNKYRTDQLYFIKDAEIRESNLVD